MKRFLVTTALGDTWPDNHTTPTLFLGEWCRRYSCRKRWSVMNAKLLPYHWDDREKLYRDYLYLREFYERLLPMVGEKLNEFHKVDHSTRYWRILVGPWLGYFLQMLFDRWMSIQQAIKLYEIYGTMILDFPEESMIPQGMHDFNEYFISDEWNHYIYAKILQQMTGIEFQVKPVGDSYKFDEILSKKQTLKRKLKTHISFYLSQILSRLGRNENAFFITTYLPYSKQWQLDLKLKQLPQFRVAVPISSIDINMETRDWNVELEERSDFERFSTKILAQQIPAAYLEGYSSLLLQLEQTNWPQRPKVIWTSNSGYNDELFKVYVAEKAEHGSSLVIGQHGGHYGVALWSFLEDHELKISDRYFSWGWSEKHKPTIKPLGQLIQKLPLGVNHSIQKHLLLVTASIPRYSYFMYSFIVSKQWLDYLEDQFAFCKSLPADLRSALKVRLYSHDFGWDQKFRWMEHLPEVKLDSGEKKIDAFFRECRICVSTINSTTFLESLSMNIPTVIFWNPNHWELRDSAKPYFEALKEVGIFHETPLSAAQHISSVWNKVDEWWTNEPVSKVVKEFCERYSNTSNDLVNELYMELNEISSDQYLDQQSNSGPT